MSAYDDRDGYIWMDGEFVPWRDSKVHVLTHALHYASSVFEGERAYSGKIFRSLDHSKRLHNSAEIMGFKIPFSVDQVEQAKTEALAKSGLESAYVRALAWRGSEMMGVSAQNNTIHLAVAVWHWGDYFADKMKGIRLTHAKWRRPAPDTAPCHAKAAGLYMICTLSKHAAERDGYADALMLDYRGQVAEATGANIFFVRDGALHTPTPDCFLNGLTRQTAIKLARERGIEVIERAIFPDELSTFSECFITGSAAEITPVAEIGEHVYKPGQISETLVNDYTALVNGRLELAL
ncbi:MULTISPECIES: branched-chain amino acid aminotransferase [unclassified Hyphomonas]|jgi:branched-chain amino acid aminotransferase|uniref:branched-chain amino acid aminotransferase n=1 Tax=unclassified Hyphomonas TaxID=2630699 RepID=UPI000C6B2D53|nr:MULTISPECIES: branched-chain amino acid aminotransferase [unclassified Hyphomonas]MBG68112.1 branched-chain amino acid aminotransferase [Hyphomonas sp.]MBO6584179.1 branched-chain amino acid aminotransferase [Hyphomonas sp.]MDF1807537.1 branched-chain amino acid aminotransferase [Hyphomonas sp.]QSR21178.1 branched-chain amino acid aminotransferase [Hyphomonas sp. KY3]RCL87501.1 MAG: branched-chain amino acid aminotransferase [Hyphomonas sp.]|tara:strand:- start:290 stop:1168 length:879 start_codon:yes stop_codon:yes gene_type:complete